KLIVDEDVRYVIELIYDLALDGYSPNKIAESLTLKKIPIPIVHKKEPRAKNVTENDGYGIWKRQTVLVY
ncbi:recombinase family protein, partial [Salmonella enterica]|uniref:recombinase family protein n=1 Tax=Salmonella enterica TaxID=28901 RepID=UPI003CF67B4C